MHPLPLTIKQIEYTIATSDDGPFAEVPVPSVIDAGPVLIGIDYDVDGEDIELEIGPVQPVGF